MVLSLVLIGISFALMHSYISGGAGQPHWKLQYSYRCQFNDVMEINQEPFWLNERGFIRSFCSLSMV